MSIERIFWKYQNRKIEFFQSDAYREMLKIRVVNSWKPRIWNQYLEKTWMQIWYSQFKQRTPYIPPTHQPESTPAKAFPFQSWSTIDQHVERSPCSQSCKKLINMLNPTMKNPSKVDQHVDFASNLLCNNWSTSPKQVDLGQQMLINYCSIGQ